MPIMPRQLENMNRLPCVFFSSVERVQWLAQVARPFPPAVQGRFPCSGGWEVAGGRFTR